MVLPLRPRSDPHRLLDAQVLIGPTDTVHYCDNFIVYREFLVRVADRCDRRSALECA